MRKALECSLHTYCLTCKLSTTLQPLLLCLPCLSQAPSYVCRDFCYSTRPRKWHKDSRWGGVGAFAPVYPTNPPCSTLASGSADLSRRLCPGLVKQLIGWPAFLATGRSTKAAIFWMRARDDADEGPNFRTFGVVCAG